MWRNYKLEIHFGHTNLGILDCRVNLVIGFNCFNITWKHLRHLEMWQQKSNRKANDNKITLHLDVDKHMRKARRRRRRRSFKVHLLPWAVELSYIQFLDAMIRRLALTSVMESVLVLLENLSWNSLFGCLHHPTHICFSTLFFNWV